MWAAVRQLTGRRQEAGVVAGITADSLSEHYAAISTDANYTAPLLKHSTATSSHPQYISAWQLFPILDSLHPTTTGLDQLPAWFLRLGAPLFCEPIARLFNLSLDTSTIPTQWKLVSTRPVPRLPTPTQHADFRPIFITPVLTRIIRTVVRRFLYPAFLSPPPNLLFTDQFAFRPTGSPSAAVICLLSTVTNLLLTIPYVFVISLDFGKAFDTVRHSTLMEKLAQLHLPLPDYVYN